MISNSQITNTFSASSGFSRVSNITKTDFEAVFNKFYGNKNISLNGKSNENSANLSAKSNVTASGCSEKILLTKYTFESESSKIRETDTGSASSCSLKQGQNSNKEPKKSNVISTCKIGDLRVNNRKALFPKHNEQTHEGDSSSLSLSTEFNSRGSFLSNNSQGEPRNFVKVNGNSTDLSKPLRLFNKNGKPLTDRVGRPLVNILGEKLVLFDDKGKVISDSKGNQVFNSLGESAIYPTTNLYIPPSEEEPGIPLLDIDKEHILFLFDNKGYPLTDSFGRVLLCSSGNPMLGMRSTSVNIGDFEHNTLKNIYSRKPLENFVRFVQIFDSDTKPLTDDCGRLLEGAKVICNRNGMPMCDGKGRPVYFKSGSRISTSKRGNKETKEGAEIVKSDLKISETSTNSLDYKNLKSPIESEQFFDMKNITIVGDRCISDGLLKYMGKSSTLDSSLPNGDIISETEPLIMKDYIERIDSCCKVDKNNIEQGKSEEHEAIKVSNENISSNLKANDKQSGVFPTPNAIENISEDNNHKTKCKNDSTETVLLFNAAKKMENQENSSVNVAHFEAIKEKQLVRRKKLTKKRYSLNFIQFFKDTFVKSNEKRSGDQYQYNEYGKPLHDIHGNLLYDKYGIPLTGAQGRRLSEGARQALRLKLKNVPKHKANPTAEGIFPPLSRNESHDQFGEPVYDKYGRPLYDLAGRLIYDRFGRPLSDAFGRPLVDPIGQPLMDREGRVLTSVYDSNSDIKLMDIFGRKIYDKRGRALFDSYGRPKYDVFTNAIYDSCGRPATDASGKILFDFLNKPIQPHPDKPLYKNARLHLPKYIDTILAVPSMYRVLKYSQRLEDVFGGPLFDDLGRPLYNKIGKPLFDRYGRPLYDKNDAPLCDCYGRPLSAEIKQNDDDQTLSVVDCLKLLKVTELSSKWMIEKNKVFKSSESTDLHKSVVMKLSYKKKSENKKSGQYVYTLTRVTKFASGRQALEILEAPLSPSTVSEMHRLPVDNKPLVIAVGQRRKQTIKHQ